MGLLHEDHRGVTNQFNTAANNGIGPLDAAHIRARLTADLFFTDQMWIPGTSLLCNPATFTMLRDDPEFFVGLLSHGKIGSILADTPSFSALAEKLIDSNSAAIATSGQTPHDVRSAASLLDQYLPGRQIVNKTQDELERAKTETSLKLVQGILRIIPELAGELHREILRSAARELNDNNGVISGSWWANAVMKDVPELAAYRSQFIELGNIMSDFAYTDITDFPLVGHPYRHDMETFSSVAEPLANANYGIAIEPGILDPHELDATFLQDHFLASVRFDIFIELARATQSERDRYYRALADFRREGSEDKLTEAKARLDEYLIALSSHARSLKLEQFADRGRSIRKLRSRILIWEAANYTIISIAVGGSLHEYAKQTLAQVDYGLLILAGLGTVGGLAGKGVSIQRQRLSARKVQTENYMRHIRPATVYRAI